MKLLYQGGWRIIGSTDACLFDPSADPPTLLSPGDQVQFVSVPAKSPNVSQATEAVLAGKDDSNSQDEVEWVEIEKSGLYSIIQDGGRKGDIITYI